MKRQTLFAEILALALVLGMTLAGCGDSPGGSNDDDTGGRLSVVYLRANHHDESEYDKGHGWTSDDQIKLSDITDVKPRKGDTLKFKISGKVDHKISWPQISLFQNYNDGYIWVGGTEVLADRPISGTFNDYTVEIFTGWAHEKFNPDYPVFVSINNNLWQIWGSGATEKFDSGTRLPAGVKKGDTMATISDFKIILVPDEIRLKLENIPVTFDSTPSVNYLDFGEWLRRDIPGSRAEVTKERLNLTLGTPKSDEMESPPSFDPTYSGDAKFYFIGSFGDTSGSYEMNLTKSDDGYVNLIYVDKEVTSLSNFKLSSTLKPGWNYLFGSDDDKTTSQTPPGGLKGVVVKN